MQGDIDKIREIIIAEIQELTDRQEELQNESRDIEREILRLAHLVEELDNLERTGETIYNRPDLRERIMGIPDDPRNPLSRQSFKDAFKRMGF